MFGVSRRALVYFLGLLAFFIFFYRSSSSFLAPDTKLDFYSPLDKDLNHWSDHNEGVTPVHYNYHAPVVLSSDTIGEIELNGFKSTKNPIKNKERVLILTPLKDAAYYLPKYMELINSLSYPHELIDLAFLVSDSKDETMATIAVEADKIQKSGSPMREVRTFRKDFGPIGADQNNVEDRHAFEFQAIRRKALGRARNYLLSAAMKPDHSWVLWLDVDIVEMPATIIEDLASHDKDVIVPNIWFHRYDDNGRDVEGRFDYNSWVESETGRALTDRLPKDTILAEGYAEYKTEREHLCRMNDEKRWNDITEKEKREEIKLDAVGGVVILVKADVHRSGINFPAYAFENQAETEGFGKMVNRAGYSLVGLVNYVVWHIDTDEKPGNLEGKA
ncbi:N-glycosyl-transferase [Taphrina deformans PYCC 5710]|uniref:N-glycosyl-transferase n=1 Tax=Taphrina deformans (strain PYCC 5710 / ATCC 11124 / CBS 356.35 / IMI 108563 / JCM 9778 / NBRC 8474) TaxID=1097556 RepID=R4XDZ0_TAPDE|nr:N-glycosyl-transferase [Taphrina deformans PYCC 5710]|eukprot:CCG82625.1 N-glycosyl-transferase [Taphrina deformans PYCC 5710]